MVDPTGMAPDGDYFSLSGKYLGSDNIKDGRIYISSGDSKNFMTASKTLVPGGLRSLVGISTSLLLDSKPSGHPTSPDKTGGKHEVMFAIDLEGRTSYVRSTCKTKE